MDRAFFSLICVYIYIFVQHKTNQQFPQSTIYFINVTIAKFNLVFITIYLHLCAPHTQTHKRDMAFPFASNLNVFHIQHKHLNTDIIYNGIKQAHRFRMTPTKKNTHRTQFIHSFNSVKEVTDLHKNHGHFPFVLLKLIRGFVVILKSNKFPQFIRDELLN